MAASPGSGVGAAHLKAEPEPLSALHGGLGHPHGSGCHPAGRQNSNTDFVVAKPPPPNPADTSGWESIRRGELGINGSTRPSQPPSFPGTKRDTGHSPTAGGTGTAFALSPAHPALPPSFLGFGVCFPDAHSRGNTQCLCRRCPPPTRHPRASLPGTAKSAAGKGPGSRLR